MVGTTIPADAAGASFFWPSMSLSAYLTITSPPNDLRKLVPMSRPKSSKRTLLKTFREAILMLLKRFSIFWGFGSRLYNFHLLAVLVDYSSKLTTESTVECVIVAGLSICLTSKESLFKWSVR